MQKELFALWILLGYGEAGWIGTMVPRMAAEFYRQVGQQQVISMAAAKAKGGALDFYLNVGKLNGVGPLIPGPQGRQNFIDRWGDNKS